MSGQCLRQTIVSLSAVGALIGLSVEPGWSEETKKGKLDEFEDEVEQSESDAEEDEEASQEDDENPLVALMTEAVLQFFYHGGKSSWLRVSGSGNGDAALPVERRSLGDPVVPFVDLDLAYQSVESDVEAIDGRAEVGYGPVGFQYRWTRYEERDPGDTLDLIQWHVLYRMAFASFFEIDLGLGSSTIAGGSRYSGMSLTTPVRIQLLKGVGAEFRPSWAEIESVSLQDYEASFRVGIRFASIRAGYRWVKLGRVSLDGPILGASVCF